MKLYRFSPINDQSELMAAVEYTHTACHQLCKNVLGRNLPVAGNIGIFCHYDQEYQQLTQIRQQLTDTSDNFNQKYFKLHQPIHFERHGDIPAATYNYLYIRHPDPYRSQVGDLDFYLESAEYVKLKDSLLHDQNIKGARQFERADPDMVELFDPDVDALAYVSDVYIDNLIQKEQL